MLMHKPGIFAEKAFNKDPGTTGAIRKKENNEP